MKKLLPFAAALALFVVPASAFATNFSFNSTATAANTNGATDNTNETDYAGGANQFDLDHHYAYTWKLSGLTIPAGHTITSASICLKDIANWDTATNRLFVHLLNTSTYGGGSDGIQSTLDSLNDDSISDYFAGVNGLGPSGLGADNTKLFDEDWNKVGQNGYVATNYVYNFNAAQLNALAAYIAANGDIAFGFDPDCHYWNNGINFSFTTAVTSTPEPISMALLGTGLAGLYVRRRRQQKSA